MRGVRPLEAGFSRFLVRPVFGDIAWAGGRIHTPAGSIDIRWEKSGGSYVGRLSHPAGLKPEFDDSGMGCKWTVTAV